MARAALQGIKNMLDICIAKGIKHAVISPGSRNAPLSILFSGSPEIRSYTITDERSAAYFALGLGQQTGMPVVLICTSGTAALNYAPAIAEAYYQFIPLIVITADRPSELLDTADGQMIDQRNLYHNYAQAYYDFPFDGEENELPFLQNEIVSEAIRTSLRHQRPVHINVPLREPLYALSELTDEFPETMETPTIISMPSISILNELETIWKRSSKIMLLAGGLSPDEELKQLLLDITTREKAILFAETHTNIIDKSIISGFDVVLASLTDKQKEFLCPDLLITFGNNLVSRKIKEYLKAYPPKYHWHISSENYFPDAFGSLTHRISYDRIDFFEKVKGFKRIPDIDYAEQWLIKYRTAQKIAEKFLTEIPFCDLSVFNQLLKKIPDNSVIQMGNSTPVRYIQLFEPNSTCNYFSNRGTSGIDGCVSTAVGFASVSEKNVTLVVGDLSFMYDSNGLLIEPFPRNLKIVVINNRGGNIFRFIEGPDKFPELDKAFVASHNRSFSILASFAGINYFFADNFEDLSCRIDEFYDFRGSAILEIVTPGDINGTILRRFFSNLNNNN